MSASLFSSAALASRIGLSLSSSSLRAFSFLLNLLWKYAPYAIPVKSRLQRQNCKTQADIINKQGVYILYAKKKKINPVHQLFCKLNL